MICKGTRQIAAALSVSKETIIVLLQAGMLPAKKVRFGRQEAWVMSQMDVETILRLRENPPLVSQESLGWKFVEQFGYRYPQTPLDHPEKLYSGSMRDIERAEQELPLEEATPYLLIKWGLTTLADWCTFVNDHRWRAEELGPLCLTPTELNRWARELKERLAYEQAQANAT